MSVEKYPSVIRAEIDRLFGEGYMPKPISEALGIPHAYVRSRKQAWDARQLRETVQSNATAIVVNAEALAAARGLRHD